MNQRLHEPIEWLAVCIGESTKLAAAVWCHIGIQNPDLEHSHKLPIPAAERRSEFVDHAVPTYELNFDDLLALPCGAADLRASSITLLAPRGSRSKCPRVSQLWTRAVQSATQSGAVVAVCYRSDRQGHEEWLDIGVRTFDLCDDEQRDELVRTIRAGHVLADTRPEPDYLPPDAQQLRFVFERIVRRQPISAALFRLVAGGLSLDEAAAQLSLDSSAAQSRVQYALRSVEQACDDLRLSHDRVRRFPSDLLGQQYQRIAITSVDTETSKREACKTHLARESAAGRAATLVIGAGLYRQLGYPSELGSWKELLLAFTSAVLDGEPSSVRESFRAAADWSPMFAWDLAVSADATRRKAALSQAEQRLRSALHSFVADLEARESDRTLLARDGDRKTTTVSRIVDAGISAILSLNVCARAFAFDFEPTKDSREDPVVVHSAKRRSSLKLFHLHGHIGRLDSLRLGTRDFGRLQQNWERERAQSYADESRPEAARGSTAIEHVLKSPLVCIGCGLTAAESTLWSLLCMRMRAYRRNPSDQTPLSYYITADRLASDTITRLNAVGCRVIETESHDSSWDLLFDCLGKSEATKTEHTAKVKRETWTPGLTTARSGLRASESDRIVEDLAESSMGSNVPETSFQSSANAVERMDAESNSQTRASAVLVSVGLPWPKRVASDRRFALGEPWPTLHGLISQAERSTGAYGKVEIRALRASGGDTVSSGIARRIARSDVLIFDVTPSRRGKGSARINQNILFEIGVARGLGKDVLLVSKGPNAHSLLPSDLTGSFVLNFSSNADRLSLIASLRSQIRKHQRAKTLR